MYYTVNIYDGETIPAVSRRKLLLKNNASVQSDLSKAVILYQPFPGKQVFGRNLVSSTAHFNTRHTSKLKTDASPLKIKTEFTSQIKQSCQIPDCNRPTSVSNGVSSLLIIALVIVIVILFFSSSKVYDKCEKNSMSVDLNLLENELNTHLYGQSIAVKTILNILEELQVTVQQLAVFVLLGGTGTGKTWTTHLIGNSMPEGVNRVNLHLGQWSNLQDIEEAFRQVDRCCHWNFLFVEDSDYASSQQIEAVLNLVWSYSQNTTCSHRKVVVMLTSNYGQSEFTELLLREREQMGTRLSINQFHIKETAMQLTSPLLNALTSWKVPYTPVPYLPLEKMQLEQCIRHDLLSKKKTASPELMNKIIQHFRFLPHRKEYFVASGCKTVSSHVNLYL